MGTPDQETATASHPLFNPPEAKTDVSALREGTNWLWDLTGRIVGRSGDMRSVVTGAAMEFSDLVTQDISNSGEYNDALWRKTCMNISFAAGVGDRWADDVIDYKNDRARLVADFETALNAGNSVSGEPSATIAEDKRRANLVRQFETMAQTRLEDLNETGRERKRMLQDGPEPAHVAKLVDAGALGWAAYNILGPGDNPPLPVSKAEAESMSRDMGAYLDGKEPDARYFEIVAALTAITNKAVALQGLDRANPNQRLSSNNLRASEIGFLKEFYAGIEDQSTRGMLFLPDNTDPQTNYGQGLEHDTSDPVREETWSALANGLLVLSDEGLGGSYDDLPPSIQRFADGEPYPNNAPGATHSAEENARAWMREAEGLERLLGRADPELQGGVEFSANVTTSAGHHLNAIDQQEHMWDGSLSSLLEVTTRNEQADHSILTGEHDNPTFDRNANALKGLYTHEWEDDGAGVAGLTDWIPEAANSDDEARQEMAREAALGLIETTAGEGGLRDELIDTGITVEAGGREVTDAAVGLVNPRIAQSFGNVATTYLDDLSDPDSPDGFSIDPGTGRMEMSYEARTRFFEYAMADQGAASRLFSGANSMDLAGTQAVAAEQAGPTDAGLRNGTLRALLDSALTAESLDRTGDDLDRQELEQQNRDRWLAIARTAAYAGTNFAGKGFQAAYASTRVATLFFGAGVGFQEYDMRVNQQELAPNYQAPMTLAQETPGETPHPYAPNKYGQTYNDSNLRYKIQLDTLDRLVRGGEVDASSIAEVSPDLIDDKGDVITYYDFKDEDERDRASTVNDVSDALDDLALNQDDRTGDRDTIQDGLERAERYSDRYREKYDEVWDDLYNRVNLDDQEQADQK
ncbi:TPR repeat region-containing protein [Streptomonospora wellingtoniae]|uniref:TPR repeat domain-containing protein n=1 Tax=Streptomonospora wellingtoniae TaxID=3075544 RepID=A0ABU2KTD2_9ACTN|nr:hypothetical protein [Streptomonospora sp. DSM 45055]MDT0302508.1 hypothetical protein [Streptomonospora sp. DSM 45055]